MINPIRHMSVFDPTHFTKRIDVIGAGASGSRIVMSLAKLGVRDIHVWDGDTIVDHNIANQIYLQDQVGQVKVEALRELVLSSTGISITIHPEMVIEQTSFGDVVFLLVDSMAARKEIWGHSIKMNIDIQLMIETRMGANSGRVYSVVPYFRTNIVEWENTLYDDEESTESACGSSISVGPTADVISGIATWQMIRWWQERQSGVTKQLESEIIFYLDPMFMSTKVF